mgnify:CR=1 FL=1
MKKEMVGCVPGNVLGMLADLAHKLQNEAIMPKELALFLQRQNPFVESDLSAIFAYWQEFWADLGQFDFSNIKVPHMVTGFTRSIIVPQGHTLNREYELCQALFPCWRWTEDLDGVVTENERKPKESYFIWVRDQEEADEGLKNFSANDIKRKKLTTQTLLERMIHERKFFKETGRHLDVSTRTLCSGSRDQSGSVPDVFWSDGEVSVDWYNSGGSSGGLRARQVVSF